MDRRPGGEESLFRRLRLRLTLVCILATGVILLGMAGATLVFSQGQLARRGEAAFQSSVNATLFHVRSQTQLDHTWMSQTEANGNLVLYIELSGRPLQYRGMVGGEDRDALIKQASEIALQSYGVDLSGASRPGRQTEQAEFRFTDASGQECRAVAAVVPLEKGNAGVLVIQSLAGEARALMQQRLVFGLFTLLSLCLMALFAWFFTRRALRPLEESRRRQTEFIAAASHELRSPLAVIHASLSAMRDAPPEKVEHFTEMADSECMRMSRLVGDMLALAGADSGAWTMRPEETEPETALLDVAEGFEAAAAEKGVRLTVELPEEALPRCLWDRQRIVQVLTILTDNGLSYTPGGGSLRLSAAPIRDGVRFTAADTGPGIPDGEKERVFTRFFRSDQSRTDREHYGLGLCIAKEIVELHGGSIWIEDTPGGGATFVVELPKK